MARALPAPEAGELEAFRDMWRAAPASLVRDLGFALFERGDLVATAVAAFAGDTLLNRVLGLGLAEPADDALLDELDAFFEDAGTSYAIALAPGAEPADLPERLAARGFEPGYAWMKFERAAAEPTAARTELRVQRVGPGARADFALAVTEGYGLSPVVRPLFEELPGREGWDCFVTYAGAEPAGAGALFAAGRAGWLGVGATRPEHRRRGSQGAILAARIARAVERGLDVVVSETGERVPGRPAVSYANLERAGLEPLYVRPNFVRYAVR